MMNSKLRSKVISELQDDDYFSSLSSHENRLSYILEEKLPFNELHSSLATTVKTFRKKAGKSLLKAKQFSDEADFFAKQASSGKFCWEQALQSYKKVRQLYDIENISNCYHFHRPFSTLLFPNRHSFLSCTCASSKPIWPRKILLPWPCTLPSWQLSSLRRAARNAQLIFRKR